MGTQRAPEWLHRRGNTWCGLEKWEDRVRRLWETGLEPSGGHLSQIRRHTAAVLGRVGGQFDIFLEGRGSILAS